MKLNSLAKSFGLAGLSACLGAAVAISLLEIDSLNQPREHSHLVNVQYLAAPLAGVSAEDIENEKQAIEINEREDHVKLPTRLL
jgi:hypothetical protein